MPRREKRVHMRIMSIDKIVWIKSKTEIECSKQIDIFYIKKTSVSYENSTILYTGKKIHS